MKKKCLLFGLVTVVCLFSPFESICQQTQTDFANYITISNGDFKDGNSVFKPLCINYIIDFACYLPLYSPNKQYYIAPCFNYSNTGTSHTQTEINDSIYPWHWCYGNNGFTEMITA